ncbi:hypothetical protein VNO78_18303 [Psophocarpus tetragonolobus]|uniref:Kinesin-like protein n=1 Tax=Psophocarpus tetragonolobus TaxID=3891 RepID=A0AAN9XM22_PSOTE
MLCAALRRYEAAGWLRKRVGVVGGKDLPAEPSEEDFRIGLRSGIILCNVLNKIQPGAVPKAGNSSRIVNCVLALKSYAEWKLGGGNGSWIYSGPTNAKPPTSGKQILRKNSEPFMKSLWSMPSGDRDGYMSDPGHDLNESGHFSSINSLVRQYLFDKKPEEIPNIEEKEDEQNKIDERDIQDKQEESYEAGYNENERVYCRVRPFLGGQPSHYSSISNVEEGNISIITPSKYGKEGIKTFNFNRAFGPSATQGEVFADTQPLIRSVLDGYNVCIFAYGQTGSGKTFTMSGPDDLNEETIGVNYRALRDLFYLSDQRKDTISYEISVQMLEIYNEQVRDLLTTDNANKRYPFSLISQNGINVPDANLVPVSCTADVINLMNLGHKNRAVGSTAMNDRSSRSHSCLTVHVQGKNLISGNTIRGSMHLVDLAGSERADKTEATGDRLKEAQHINKSLSALGDVISSLAQKNAHVPYRNSKLTQLLQDSLGGQAKTLMFVHISPEPDALGETLSTLKFAERVSTVELGAARVNKDNSDVKELKEQIFSLKAALARKEEEVENFQQSSNCNSHEMPKLKSYASSPPIQRSWTGGARKLPKDDTSSLDGQQNTASKLKRRSLDLHDMRRNSPPWPPARSQGKAEDKETISGDWVDDKISMKRNDSLTSDDSLVGQLEIESKQSSPMLSPTFLFEPSKICSDQSLNKNDNKDSEDLHKHEFDMATITTDESDENEIATSDSSEADLHWPTQIPKPITISSGLGIKAKKSSNPRAIKNPEPRSMIPSFIPAPLPSRKQLTQVTQGRKYSGSIDVKKRIGNAK